MVPRPNNHLYSSSSFKLRISFLSATARRIHFYSTTAASEKRSRTALTTLLALKHNKIAVLLIRQEFCCLIFTRVAQQTQ